MIPRGYFITGTDTGVGKTVLTCLLATELQPQGLRVAAYKPACSGAEVREGTTYWSDLESLHQSTGGRFDRDRICPQRFLAPLSPHAAARDEGRFVDEELLVTGYHWLAERADVVLVEGAGGFYSPLSANWLNADLAQRLQLPVLIVAPNRLGTINQTLLTIEAVRSRGLTVAGVVLNQWSANADESIATNRDEICRRGSVEIFAEIDFGARLLSR